MKVLFLGRYNLSENLTGPEKVAKRIFGEYTNENKSVFIEYFFEGRKFGYFKKFFGKEKLIEESNYEVMRLGIMRVFLYLIREKPSIIHVITYERFAIVSFIYKFFFNVKIIYNVHGIIYYENIYYRKTSRVYRLKDKICENIYLTFSDKLVFLSERSIKIASKYFKVHDRKIIILPNGIDEIFYLKGTEKKNESLGKLKIVFIGEIDRIEKGFDFIANCLMKVSFSYEFFIISKNRNENMKCDNKNFYFVDNFDTNQYATFLEDKNIFISGSLYEPFSISAAECMASGLVPIVTKETGISRYIKNFDNGFVFNHGDKDEFANALEMLNTNRKLLNDISERATLVYSELSWRKVFQKYKKIYECI